ncbi:MAG: hypothetical protein MPJ52_03370 [Alphaproteobacteria bacterium]|nr:hypothetical protein [Alphaproteobacteria bacterium]
MSDDWNTRRRFRRRQSARTALVRPAIFGAVSLSPCRGRAVIFCDGGTDASAVRLFGLLKHG